MAKVFKINYCNLCEKRTSHYDNGKCNVCMIRENNSIVKSRK